MEHFDDSLIGRIASFLTTEEQALCRQVCRRWARCFQPGPLSPKNCAINVTLLTWALDAGLPLEQLLTVDACAQAAGAGSIKLLQSLKDYGCPWDETAGAHAAKGGHLGPSSGSATRGHPALG